MQAIGLFAQATCAPEFGLPRLFNQRLLVMHVGGGIVQLYWDNILGRCLDFSEQVRQSDSTLLSQMLKNN